MYLTIARSNLVMPGLCGWWDIRYMYATIANGYGMVEVTYPFCNIMKCKWKLYKANGKYWCFALMTIICYYVWNKFKFRNAYIHIFCSWKERWKVEMRHKWMREWIHIIYIPDNDKSCYFINQFIYFHSFDKVHNIFTMFK